MCLPHVFLPLMCPTLRSISFGNAVSDKTDGVVASRLLDTLCHRGAELLDISYQGSTSPRIFMHITQFPTLRSIDVRPIDPRNYAVAPYSGTLAAISKLQRLTTLGIDFRMFSSTSQFGHELASLGTLSNLRLCGSWENIQANIFNHYTFKTIRRLSLVFDFPFKPISSDQRVDKDLFFLISSTFPHIRSLSLEVRSYQKHAWNSAITFQNLMELRWNTVECIDLRHVPILLSTQEINNAITLWPTLTRLSIIPEDLGLGFEARLVLSHMCSHGVRLHTLNLPLDFSVLNVSLPLAIEGPSKCPLRRLELFRPQNLPKTLQGKLLFAQCLLRLFPKLAIVASSDNRSSDGVQDIQYILHAFHGLLSGPPQLNIQHAVADRSTNSFNKIGMVCDARRA